jgi:hypothetical protein
MGILAAVLLALAWFTGTAFGIDWVDFTVARHTNTTFATATFDNAMPDVNLRLQLDNHNCSDDVPCTVRFRRSGALGTFGSNGDGLDAVDTQNELDQVFGVNSHRVKVVTTLSRCAGTNNPSFIGCGRCDDFGFVLEDWVNGSTYVHEYGHNVNLHGCDHNNGCTMNIMNAVIIQGNMNDAVTAEECSGYGGRPYTQLCGDVYDGRGGPLTAAGGPYWVTCNVTVPAGQTLTIDPGVEIQFHQGTTITSNGTTTVDGGTDRVLVYSNNQGLEYPSIKVDAQMVVENGGELYPH